MGDFEGEVDRNSENSTQISVDGGGGEAEAGGHPPPVEVYVARDGSDFCSPQSEGVWNQPQFKTAEGGTQHSFDADETPPYGGRPDVKCSLKRRG